MWIEFVEFVLQKNLKKSRKRLLQYRMQDSESESRFEFSLRSDWFGVISQPFILGTVYSKQISFIRKLNNQVYLQNNQVFLFYFFLFVDYMIIINYVHQVSLHRYCKNQIFYCHTFVSRVNSWLNTRCEILYWSFDQTKLYAGEYNLFNPELLRERKIWFTGEEHDH